MVTSLPRGIRLKLDQTLAQWPRWRCEQPLPFAPRVQECLRGGLSNYSVLVAAGEQRFVVRIDGINPRTHGLNRQTEWRVLNRASERRLAPTPRYFNPELGAMVCDYLAPDQQQPLHIADLAGLLREIHTLPAIHIRLDLRERILRYERQLEQTTALPGLTEFHPKIMQLLEDSCRQSTTTAVCHNDLLRANRLYSAGKIVALDWEYAAMASPWYELAVIIAGDALCHRDQEELLHGYLQRDADAIERQLVDSYACIYRYLELLWYMCSGPAAGTRELLEAKTGELARSLGAIC